MENETDNEMGSGLVQEHVGSISSIMVLRFCAQLWYRVLQTDVNMIFVIIVAPTLQRSLHYVCKIRTVPLLIYPRLEFWAHRTL